MSGKRYECQGVAGKGLAISYSCPIKPVFLYIANLPDARLPVSTYFYHSWRWSLVAACWALNLPSRRQIEILDSPCKVAPYYAVAKKGEPRLVNHDPK